MLRIQSDVAFEGQISPSAMQNGARILLSAVLERLRSNVCFGGCALTQTGPLNSQKSVKLHFLYLL